MSVRHSICTLKFNVPNEMPVVFRNGSNYDYDFIIKKLANEFEGKLTILGKIQKCTKLSLFQRLIKMVMKVFYLYLTK